MKMYITPYMVYNILSIIQSICIAFVIVCK